MYLNRFVRLLSQKPIMESKEALRNRLSPLQWAVTQEKDTERPFTGVYCDYKLPGQYNCIVCRVPLFQSQEKFESGCGWPSFFRPVSDQAVRQQEDRSLGMVRVEALCANCGAHLGHWFPDGPKRTRYCINSASIDFQAK